MRNRAPIRLRRTGSLLVVLTTVLIVLNQGYAQESGKKGSSYAPVVIKEDFATIVGRMKAAKPG
ncbi:MAG: hypothetical protein QMD05_10055, partial [Candidatus Brocadiaceae bacterium]|nr:hypothetical protein [Candidatus Brocadiaceae bacterium]